MEPTIKLNEALAKSQGEFPPIQKGRTARVQTKGGTSFSYDYADLEDVFAAVRPVLSRNGLAIQHRQKVVQPLGVETVCILRHVSGEVDVGEPLVIPCSGDMQPTQAIGSAMTYGRRYTTQSMLGISTETDDDGNAASGNDAETKPKAEKPACPKCGKPDFVFANKPPKPAGFYCWHKPDAGKHGCGNQWSADVPTSESNGMPDDRRPVEPTRSPAPPKETEAKVSEGLRDLLRAIGCKSNEEADAVIRLCTSGKNDLEKAKAGASETCRIAIEMTLSMHMQTCGERAKALGVLYSDALSKVEK